jgi:hypothetical protein
VTARRSPWPERALIAGALIAAAALVIGAASRIGHGRLGDFTHFYAAAEAVRAGADVRESGEGGYIYPPLFAFLLQPLTLISQDRAAMVWLGLNAGLLFLSTVLASAQGAARFAPVRAGHATLVLASVGFLLTLDKTRATLNQEQTDSLVLLGFVLALVWLERRPALAGLAIGFAANIKYLSLITLPYLLIRRRWAAASWAAGSTIAWALLPAVSLGWAENLRALSGSLAGLMRAVGLAGGSGAANIHPADWHLSLSVTSAVSRLVGPEAPALVKGVAVMLVGLAVLGVAGAVYKARGRSLIGREPAETPSGRAATALEWCGLIVASLAFGPQTTGRHLVLLLAVHPFAAAIFLRPGPLAQRGLLVAGVVLLQLGMVLPPGGKAFEAALDSWRAVGGASWCMLAMYMAMLWVGLPQGEHHAPKPAADPST